MAQLIVKIARFSFNGIHFKGWWKNLGPAFANWISETVFSYPDGQETEAGKFNIVYDYNRTTNPEYFLSQVLTEQDISTMIYDKKHNKKI